MTHPLNDQNPEYITWQYEALALVLLGGISIAGLHSMRVTMKVNYKSLPAIRHSLDLYNEHQLHNWAKRIAEHFTLNPTFVSKALMELTDLLENYRLQKIEQNQQAPETLSLTAEQRTAAIQFLQAPHLLQRTNQLIGEAGLIGEENNRLIMYLVFTSRKTNSPLHIISFGSSGTGKSHLQEKIAELIPATDKLELTSITGNAFYYYDSDHLAHKLILIEDYDGVQSALYPIRELQSKQRITKTVSHKDKSGQTKTLQLNVYGPVCIAGSTTQESIYEDNVNRSFLLYLDESKAQDERIMQYQRQYSAGIIDTSKQQQVQQFLQDVQSLLQNISVRNPYAEQLILPPEIFKPRRTNAHYIAFIEAITFYKQYQRSQQVDKNTGEVYLESTLEDIQEAGELMKDILLKKADELGFSTRQFLEKIKAYLQDKQQNTFTNKEIRLALKEHRSKQKRFMLHLQDYGYIYKVDGDQKKGYQYAIQEQAEYTRLQENIYKTMDELIDRLTSSHTKTPRKNKPK